MKVFNFDELKKDIVDSTNEIMATDSKSNAKTNKMMSVAEKAMKELSYVYPNLATLKNKVTLIRSAIADECPRHHLFDSSVSELVDSSKWLKSTERLSFHSAMPTKTIAAKIREAIETSQDLAVRCDNNGDADKRDEYLQLKGKLESIKIFSETYYRINLAPEQTKMLKESDAQRVKAQLSNLTTIGINQVIELIHKLLNSDHMYELALGLALATGRRSSEVFCSAQFEVLDKYKLNFSGQLKKKFWQGNKDIEYFIYTLVPADLVVSAHDKLRNYDVVKSITDIYLETGNTLVINKKFSKGCSNISKKYLGAFDATRKFTFKDTRAIWGAIALNLFFDDPEWENCAKEVFLQHQYGHDNPSAQLDYVTFEIVDDKPLQKPLKKANNIIDHNFLTSIDDEVIEGADSDRLGFKAQLLIDAHIKTQEFVEVYGAFNHGRTIYKKTRKMGGVGLTAYVADAYVAIIENKLNRTK